MKNPFVSPILAPYVEITVLSCPNFVGKTFIFSKKLCYHVIFKKLIIKNHLLSCPYLMKKCHSVKTTPNYVPKKSFFPDFSQQSLLSCSYFVKKHLYPKKKVFHLHIYNVKNAPYLKCTMLSCHFFSNFS